MSFPRYSKYRDSGVEWLGEVPEHWDAKRFKQVFRERDERSTNGVETLLSVSSYTGVSPRSEIIDEGDYLSRADSLEGYKVCHPNDLVMNIMLAWNRGLAFSNYEGIVSPAYCVFSVVDGSVPGFLNYLVRTDLYTLYFKAFSSGVIDSRLRLYPDDFGSLFCVLPTIQEQQAIVAFLDRETARIDALIAAQRHLIDLLKEKRQAVISHAVTKGLNPNAPMKDSGVEWLGEVPEHWDLPKLKRFTEFSGGGTPSRDKPEFWNGDIPWVSPKDMKTERITCTEEFITKEGLSNSTSNLLPTREILMVVRSGILKHTIPVAINDVPVALNQDMKAMSFAEGKCCPEFFLRWIQGLNAQLLLAWSKQGATVESIEHDYLVETIVPLPTIDEQRAIVTFLDYETARIDNLISTAGKAVNFLQERRSALISATVTGKIDLRSISVLKPTVVILHG